MGPPFLPDGNGTLGVPDRPKKVIRSLFSAVDIGRLSWIETHDESTEF